MTLFCKLQEARVGPESLLTTESLGLNKTSYTFNTDLVNIERIINLLFKMASWLSLENTKEPGYWLFSNLD